MEVFVLHSLRLCSLLASPVHIVGGSHPQIEQPSKVLNVFPRPSGTEDLVLGDIDMLPGHARKHPLPPKSGTTHSHPPYK